MIRFVYTVM